MFNHYMPRTYGESKDVLFHVTCHHTKKGMEQERTFFLRASPDDLEGTQVQQDTLGIVLNSLGISPAEVNYIALVRVEADLAKVSTLTVK